MVNLDSEASARSNKPAKRLLARDDDRFCGRAPFTELRRHCVLDCSELCNYPRYYSKKVDIENLHMTSHMTKCEQRAIGRLFTAPVELQIAPYFIALLARSLSLLPVPSDALQVFPPNGGACTACFFAAAAALCGSLCGSLSGASLARAHQLFLYTRPRRCATVPGMRLEIQQ